MVKGPEAGLIAAPWTLNPYAYGLQSPTLFWDPDGAWPKLVDDVREGFGTAALVAGGAREPLTPNQLVDRGYWFTLGYLQYGAWTDRLASGKGPSVAALVPPRLQLPGMPVRKALPPMAPKGDSTPGVPVASGGTGNPRTSSSVAGSETRGLATEANQAVFWSGIGKGGDSAAATWAARNGGVTLESTLAARGIKLPSWDPANPSSTAAWRNASMEFAAGARGNVRVLQGEALRTNAIWRDEYRVLLANPHVTSITAVDPNTGAAAVLWSR